MPRSKDFRYIYSNSFKFTFLGNEAQLVFALQQELAEAPDAAEQQVGVVLSPVGVKSLVQTLGLFIEDYELAMGAPIAVDPSILEPMRQTIAAARNAREAAKGAKGTT